MTYEELEREVVNLGFEANVDSVAALASAVNRTLSRIDRIRPNRAEAVLSLREPLYAAPEVTAIDTPLTISCGGAFAVTFEYIGSGTLSGIGSTSESLSSPVWRAKRIILQGGTQQLSMTFTGTTDFAVRSFAVLAPLANRDNATLLPVYGKERIFFDLSGLDDYAEPDDYPYTESGFPVRDYEARGTMLYLPAYLRGNVLITYRRKRTAVTADNFAPTSNSASVDVEPDLAYLVPLGVASFVWLEVEPEKATYYEQLFQEGLTLARMASRHEGRESVIRRKGW